MRQTSKYKNKIGALMLPAIIFFFSISMTQCTQAINPEDLPRIELTAENVVSKEVWLRVKFINIQQPWEFVLERDGQRVGGWKLSKTDTLVIDTSAAPRTSHRYKAIQMEGTVRTLESEKLQVQTLDTSSHLVEWIVDTLGVRGTIFDVWAFSKDNVWAVGEIDLSDPTGRIYNLARWNGERWSIERVFYDQSLLIFRTMFAFGGDDVWVGGSTQPMHWDGVQWRKFGVTSSVFGGSVRKIWGTSSSNVFMVGTNGSIAHYNGTSWQNMGSGTTVDLEDVWGIQTETGIRVWATGTTSQDGRSVVLFYDGGHWVTVYDNLGKPRELDFAFSTVWTNNPRVLYLAGLSVVTKASIPDQLFRQHQTGQRYISYRLRGTDGNDVFVTGPGSEVAHFNGSTWHVYPEIKAIANQFSTAWWLNVHAHQDHIVLGGFFFTGSSGVPAVIRGTR